MPRFDGTGPAGQGPLTGGGRGYCIVPLDQNPNMTYGANGMQNYPVNTPYYYSAVGRPGMSYSIYPAYDGVRSAGYYGRPGSFNRGARAGGMFFRRTGIRGRGRR